MIKKIIIITALIVSHNLIQHTPTYASSRLQSIQQGMTPSSSSSTSKAVGGDGQSEEGINLEPDDIVFLGVFQTYSPKIRKNLQLAIYAEPTKFKFAKRACTKIIKIRDRINTYLYNNPPKIIKKRNVDTKDLDAGIRKAVKKALKTKREYFTSFYVVSGNYNDYKKPEELKELSIVNCERVIEQAKEIEKEAKKGK